MEAARGAVQRQNGDYQGRRGCLLRARARWAGAQRMWMGTTISTPAGGGGGGV